MTGAVPLAAAGPPAGAVPSGGAVPPGGSVPLAGVIGHPVAHSRSPALHGHWLRALGLRGHYVPLEVHARHLDEALRALPIMGFVGANVTIPHKGAALALAAEATERARRIGAANTLTFGEGGIHADNTDGEGFLAALRAGAPGWRAEAGPALVLGAGGAARAVVDALVREGAAVRIANRTARRAEALASELGGEALSWEEAGEAVAEARLVVNTTSLGMTGAAPMALPLGGLRPGMAVMDLVYAPLRTPLLAAAEAAGAAAVDGLGMLLHQAAPGFERWFGTRPPVDDAARAAALGTGAPAAPGGAGDGAPDAGAGGARNGAPGGAGNVAGDR